MSLQAGDLSSAWPKLAAVSPSHDIHMHTECAIMGGWRETAMTSEQSEHSLIRQSRFQVEHDGVITYDPETAHTAAGDPGYARRLPSCAWCAATALAEEEAKRQAEDVDDGK